MEETILSKYSVESNGETVIVRVIQTEKGVKVEIEGETPDVVVNGDIIFSKYDKEEYKYIPAYLRPFIEKYLCGWGDGFEKDDKEVKVDLEIEGREFLATIPVNKAKNNKMLLRDWIIEYSMLEDCNGNEIENGAENFEAFKKAVKDLGCEIRYSHGGNDYDNWYDLVVPMDKSFTEEMIVKCVKLWNNYNENLISKYLNGRY